MGGANKKKKPVWQQQLMIGIFMLIGGCCGFLIGMHMGTVISDEAATGERILSMLVLVIGMYAAIFFQLVIHEAGHLVFGLLTGYRFSSFRIGSFMWVKDGELIRMKRMSLAGTGGQCLMGPPDWKDETFPVVLYNLGGCLMNLIGSLIFFLLAWAAGKMSLTGMVFLIFASVGLFIGAMNGIPLRLGLVDNDGYNALSMTKNREARRAFWLQMKMNEQIAAGVRLKDMPGEWFAMPGETAMKNSMAASIAVFACNRLMDEKNFDQAGKEMKRLLEMDSAIVGVHRNLMVCDCMYLEMIGENRREVIDEMFDQNQKTFMKSMKRFPSVIRTEYLYALLVQTDETKAEEWKKQFEECARTYPYPSDIESERELISIAIRKREAQMQE
ncbi:MAG: hypothetical protein IJ468_01770 [Lachnospiraceae bacterium]|nr:hypothetical protein [Lachnospiraceae bacterium]